jgi:hypothetical protein
MARIKYSDELSGKFFYARVEDGRDRFSYGEILGFRKEVLILAPYLERGKDCLIRVTNRFTRGGNARPCNFICYDASYDLDRLNSGNYVLCANWGESLRELSDLTLEEINRHFDPGDAGRVGFYGKLPSGENGCGFILPQGFVSLESGLIGLVRSFSKPSLNSNMIVARGGEFYEELTRTVGIFGAMSVRMDPIRNKGRLEKSGQKT